MNGEPPQPYRIGKRKGAYDFINDAIMNDFTDPHVFTVERINKVTEEFLALGDKLGKVATDVMMGSHESRRSKS
jgi:hypothetical protein